MEIMENDLNQHILYAQLGSNDSVVEMSEKVLIIGLLETFRDKPQNKPSLLIPSSSMPCHPHGLVQTCPFVICGIKTD